MNASYDKNTALVVLPPVRGGRLQDKSLRAWLAQSELTLESEPRELLSQLTDELGLPYLRIETDYNPSDSARLAVRVEALFETALARRAASSR